MSNSQGLIVLIKNKELKTQIIQLTTTLAMLPTVKRFNILDISLPESSV